MTQQTKHIKDWIRQKPFIQQRMKILKGGKMEFSLSGNIVLIKK